MNFFQKLLVRLLLGRKKELNAACLIKGITCRVSIELNFVERLAKEHAADERIAKTLRDVQRLPAVRIEADGVIAKLFISGKQLKGVRSYALAQSRNGFPILNVELVCGSIISDISDMQIMYAPTSEERGREQDEEDYGWLKDAMARSDESGNTEQVDSDSFANANR